MIEPLFWTPLPSAAEWLTQKTGRPIDMRLLLDTVVRLSRERTNEDEFIARDPMTLLSACASIGVFHRRKTWPTLTADVPDGPVRLVKEKVGAPKQTAVKLRRSSILLLMSAGWCQISRAWDDPKSRNDTDFQPTYWEAEKPYLIEPKQCGFWEDDLLALTERITTQTAATPAPVEAVGASCGVMSDKDGPLPLTTGDIAFCFAGLRWDEQQWKKPLGDKPEWLRACIAIPGKRGVSETRWNPVLIGASLVSAGHAKPKSVRAKFQTQPLLNPWLDEWRTYEADNLSAD